MNKHGNQRPDPREVLVRAEKAAAGRAIDEALRLFQECTGEYLHRGMPFKAIAVAKRARSVLGPIPKVRSLIIRLYQSSGLHGDARQEYLLAASSLRKEEVPLFRALDEDAFIELLSAMEIIPAAKGTAVMKQDQKGEDVFVVLTGALEVVRDSVRLSTMEPGDLFGELGFFCKGKRSASVKALEKSTLAWIPSAPLQELKSRHSCLRQYLEGIYGERILKKAREDLGNLSPTPARPDIVATLRYPRGHEIPLDSHLGIAVVKHGIVEIDYDDMTLRRKEYLRPGSILPGGKGRARANTNVVILLTSAGR